MNNLKLNIDCYILNMNPKDNINIEEHSQSYSIQVEKNSIGEISNLSVIKEKI